MSSGPTIGVALGVYKGQLSIEQLNLKHTAEENEKRVKLFIGANYRFFTLVQFTGKVHVNGKDIDVSRKVYQRHDINFNDVDPKNGLTNIERMKLGKPPLGNDGKPIQLHHITQTETGSMVEIRELTHKEYYSTLHGLTTSGRSFRNNPLKIKQYNNFRAAYWKWRAKEYEQGNHNDE